MKVYEFDPMGKPKEKRFKEYSMLATDDETHEYLAAHQFFEGVPFGARWKTPTFYIEKPLVPKPDFFWPGGSAVVCNEKARDLAGEAMEMSGELLPIRVEGEKSKYWIYNITNTINVVDAEKSKWEELLTGSGNRMLVKPAFIPSRFGEETIFKIPEDRGARMYCVEFTGDPDEGEFKAVVEHYQLTGLSFELVWTDEE
jgi:hypothetical protein